MIQRSAKRDSCEKAAEAYIAVLDEVLGWLSVEAARLFCALDAVQTRLGITGDVFEIGVHHGRSALLLSCLVDGATESLKLNDVFARQEANVSGSGSGDKDAFLKNLARLRPGFHGYQIFEGPSRDLTARETGTNCRIFHIDGGHTAEETAADLELASQAIHAGGVIAIDDYFNGWFPAVSEGVNRFLARSTEVRPFLVGYNKMLLCREPFSDRYREEVPRVAAEKLEFLSVTREFWGGEVIVIDTPACAALRFEISPRTHTIECRAGERVAVELQVRNRGIAVTPAIGKVDLDHHLYRGSQPLAWDNHRVSLCPLAEDGLHELTYELRAPAEPGHYVVKFDVAVEGVCWLSELGRAPTPVALVVTRPEARRR